MSLFDKPKIDLSPSLFTRDEKMLTIPRDYILNEIASFTDINLLSSIFLYGSMVGRQHNNESDIDVNLILKPGMDRYDYKDALKKYNGTMLPGTMHPINYYVANYSPPENMQKSEYAVYDLLTNKWVVQPKRYDEIRDPQVEFQGEIAYANLASRANLSHDKLESDRKFVYKFGWGIPRELQQNILYKLMEKIR